MDLTLVAPPAAAPVSLAEAKAHLRVLGTAEDMLIGALVTAATAHFDGRQGVLGRSLVTQTWEVRYNAFPGVPRGRMELPLPPLQSVVSIKYLDGLGTETTLDPAAYVVEPGHHTGRVRPSYGLTWPTARDEDGAVRIRFIAGYGGKEAVPSPIKQAILLLVGHWWINREAVGDAKGPHAFAVDALTNPYRMWAA
jgi:uncharacterized phiE125 gp8 family phage protein